MGSPGVEEVRWLKPVRPGDTLRARFTVTDARPSRSRPDRGVVTSLSEVLNQHGEVVMTVRGLSMFARRPA
jgi:acyl dehydratase